MIRILLADDHPVVRDGLRGMLAGEADFEVVGEAASGVEAVRLTEREQPDVVLMDLQMPGVDGVQATRAIMGERLGVDVLVLTSFSDSERIIGALQSLSELGAGAHPGLRRFDSAKQERVDGDRNDRACQHKALPFGRQQT